METRTSIIIPQEEMNELDKIAQQEDRTRSQLIRIAIKNYLKNKQVIKIGENGETN